ncbi:Adenosylcobinamide kinase [Methylocella silvestris BL2]|uniref:Bifunctional adenosylcobalamin biosynthesis protein n=1 Tax=Methylocella silvestris (strain DSM 15510 / CIP 108128 / LMG 27833 / NCIMB 13906 / BL2) TaxID=395965 RepID=B8ELU3_METSB|nr:bifunctional adenosylcobinamide kinase/adenosylcobinamide-phosphate guanylyltransferase [Methylocella silvestris]ACK50724.1 Adenosylcobinamide kinase [Methylocella silvestris BL2]
MTPTEPPTRSLLVLGGARSGKSRYAQKLAESSGARPVIIATAEAHDAEMRARIARHAAERGPGWTLVEEPIALVAALLREARPGRIVLIDCATLWLSNLLLRDADCAAATAELAASLARLEGPCIFVSNEVGGGIVPENALARAFRDAQGTLNQALAEACGAVVQICAGLPLQLKPGVAPRLRF